MSLQYYAVGCLAGAATLVLAYLAFKGGNRAINQYRQHFTETARVRLADVFIFIEPEKLYAINIALIAASFLIVWVWTGAWPLALLVSVLVGLSPKAVYAFLKSRRQERFLQDLPDALTALSGMMRSGSSLNMSLELVVTEVEGPIEQEFGLLLKELRMGVDYGEALDNMLRRMPLDELALVVAGMKISREVGGNLSDILSRLADTIRRKLEMEGKIKALTAQGKYQGMVMAALPIFLALIISKMEPEAMSRLFSEPIGWGVCFVVIVFELVGYYFIRKIVTIDV